MGIVAALYLVVWVLYLESPVMGNVWWRTGSAGSKEFTPWGIWATAAAPFKRGHGVLWTPAFWDVNPWPILGILVGLGVWFNETNKVELENCHGH